MASQPFRVVDQPRAPAGLAPKVSRGGRRDTCLTHCIPDAARCEDSPEPSPTATQAATSLGTQEGVTWGGHSGDGVGLHAAEGPTSAEARRQAVRGQGPAQKGSPPCVPSVLRSGLRATQGAADATHTDRRTGTAGLEALDLCSSAARQRVPVCAVVACGAGKGAQGTAIPLREEATRIPHRRGKRWGSVANRAGGDSYCRRTLRNSGLGFGCWLLCVAVVGACARAMALACRMIRESMRRTGGVVAHRPTDVTFVFVLACYVGVCPASS